MRPVLFSLRIGSHELALSSYGVLIAVGLAVGIALAYRQGRRQGLDGGLLLDLAFWLTVAGLVGARLAYGLVNAGQFASLCVDGDGGPRGFWRALGDCTRILHVWQGGLVFYGGAAGGAVVAALFARRHRWSFWMVGDLFAPAVAAGHAFGRLGCFAAGCCYGKAAAVPWAVTFPQASVAFDELSSVSTLSAGATLTPPLHPTQLYEAVGELALLALLLGVRGRMKERPGALLLLYAALYAVLRFVIEAFRGDVSRLYVGAWSTARLAGWLGLPPAEPLFLSVAQLVSLVLLVAVLATWIHRRRAWKAARATHAA